MTCSMIIHGEKLIDEHIKKRHPGKAYREMTETREIRGMTYCFNPIAECREPSRTVVASDHIQRELDPPRPWYEKKKDETL